MPPLVVHHLGALPTEVKSAHRANVQRRAARTPPTTRPAAHLFNGHPSLCEQVPLPTPRRLRHPEYQVRVPHPPRRLSVGQRSQRPPRRQGPERRVHHTAPGTQNLGVHRPKRRLRLLSAHGTPAVAPLLSRRLGRHRRSGSGRRGPVATAAVAGDGRPCVTQKRSRAVAAVARVRRRRRLHELRRRRRRSLVPVHPRHAWKRRERKRLRLRRVVVAVAAAGDAGHPLPPPQPPRLLPAVEGGCGTVVRSAVLPCGEEGRDAVGTLAGARQRALSRFGHLPLQVDPRVGLQQLPGALHVPLHVTHLVCGLVLVLGWLRRRGRDSRRRRVRTLPRPRQLSLGGRLRLRLVALPSLPQRGTAAAASSTPLRPHRKLPVHLSVVVRICRQPPMVLHVARRVHSKGGDARRRVEICQHHHVRGSPRARSRRRDLRGERLCCSEEPAYAATSRIRLPQHHRLDTARHRRRKRPQLGDARHSLFWRLRNRRRRRRRRRRNLGWRRCCSRGGVGGGGGG
eukprot:Rhum_TRINITY_DN14788_c11_g1::Rhum_TRINITY_DN14788_c11_g1_i1::g.119101::m.119101